MAEVFFSQKVSEQVKAIESDKRFPVLPADSCFDLPDSPTTAEAAYWLQDRFSIFDRMLIDLVWRLSEQPVDGVAVIDRSEVPEGLESPQYPLDVAIVSGTKRIYLAHTPQNASYLNDWPASLSEKIVSLLVSVSDALHRAIPVVSIDEFIAEGHYNGTIDWIGKVGDGVVMRIQCIDAARSCVIWRRIYCDGRLVGMFDTPINFYLITQSEDTGVWNFMTTEDDFQIYPLKPWKPLSVGDYVMVQECRRVGSCVCGHVQEFHEDGTVTVLMDDGELCRRRRDYFRKTVKTSTDTIQ